MNNNKKILITEFINQNSFEHLNKKFVKIVVVEKTDSFTFDRFVDRVQNQDVLDLKISENFNEFEFAFISSWPSSTSSSSTRFKLKLFDELEEWHLIQGHYSISVAINEDEVNSESSMAGDAAKNSLLASIAFSRKTESPPPWFNKYRS